MAKTTSVPLTRHTIKDRIRDESSGIRPGRDGAPSLLGCDDEAPRPPDVSELGLPTKVRKELGSLVVAHASLGQVQREAEKDRKAVGDKIKGLLTEHVPDDVPTFICEGMPVTRFTQNRTDFNRDVARDQLLALGVQPAKINKAFAAATSVKVIPMLKITPVGEEG